MSKNKNNGEGVATGKAIVLATWSSGVPACAEAWTALSEGGSALDAVETGCRNAELDLRNHTVGIGGLPDRDGQVSVDGAMTLSPARRGAVCAMRKIGTPVAVARLVMERTPHVLIAGDAADAFAIANGFKPVELLTPEAKAEWEKWKASKACAKEASLELIPNIEEKKIGRVNESNHDTIGLLALDRSGTIAAACSTSGLAWKVPGRVGDSPIIGHGLYCEPGIGCAVCTGHGELVSGVCGSFAAVELMRHGASPQDAGEEVLNRIVRNFELSKNDQIGMIVMNARGEWSGVCLRPGFRTAIKSDDREELAAPDVVIFPE